MSNIFILEGNITMREAESRVFSVVWEDFSSIAASTSSGAGQSSVSVEGYVNGSSDTASMFSGAPSATENTLTLPLFTVPAGTGGSIIVIEPHMTSTGKLYKTGIVVNVLKPGSAR